MLGMVLTIIAVGVTILIAVFSAWVYVKVSIAKLQVKVLELENKFDEEKTNSKRTADNIENIFKLLTDIRLSLQNKQDRKN